MEQKFQFYVAAILAEVIFCVNDYRYVYGAEKIHQT
jgi:hypothetical protein